MKKKCAAVAAAIVLMAALSGCNIIAPGFADYDVSGYIKALLDSSYLDKQEDFISFTNSTEEKASENNAFTVENAAIHFCNGFNVYPSDDQMLELQEIMKEAYKLAKYTVRPKEESNTGYYVGVEIQPLTVFQDCADEFEEARQKARDGLLLPESGVTDGTPEMDEESFGDGYESSEASQAEENPFDENKVFVDEVIRIARDAVRNRVPAYASSIVITLDIRKSDEGDLSLDTVQIEKIDATVIAFTPKS